MIVRHLIGQRPKQIQNFEIPDNFLIFNAPRPMSGQVEWQGDFVCGIFFAAVDPGDAKTIADNIDNGGVVLQWHSVDEVMEYGRRRCEQLGADPEAFTYNDFANSFILMMNK